MKERLVQLEVLRYNPDTDTEAHFQRYEVTCAEEWVVLCLLYTSIVVRRNRHGHLAEGQHGLADAIAEAFLELPAKAFQFDAHGIGLFGSAGNGSRAADLALQLDQAVEQGLGSGRATRHIDIDGHDAVHAAHHLSLIHI